MPVSRAFKVVHLRLSASEDGHVTVTLRPSTSAVRMRGHVSGDLSYIQLLMGNDKVCLCVKMGWEGLGTCPLQTLQASLSQGLPHRSPTSVPNSSLQAWKCYLECYLYGYIQCATAGRCSTHLIT
jgi:hypothetical protein